MTYYLGTLLALIVCFPWLFSWFAPFVFLAFAWTIVLRANRIAATLDLNIVFGFCVIIITGLLVLGINLYLFQNIEPWTYWFAGFVTWLLIVILFKTLQDPSGVVHGALLTAGIVSGVGNLVYIALYFSGIATDPISIAGYQAYFGLDQRGFFAYSTSHLPHITFLVPYFVCHFASGDGRASWVEKVAVLTMTLAGLLSLRSFVWLALLFSLFYYFYHTKRWRLLLKLLVLMASLSVALYLYIGIDYDIVSGIYDLKWSEKFDGSDIRLRQFAFWLKSFAESPLIGHGLTSAEITLFDIATGELIEYSPGPVVSDYGYELLYAKMLSDIGIIFFVYVTVFAWLSFFIKTKNVNDWQVHGLRVAAVVMLIQSMTNSYLQTSGWLFVLMLPIFFVSTRPRTSQYGIKIS